MFRSLATIFIIFLQCVSKACGLSLGCTFDEDVCNWSQENTEDFTWKQDKNGHLIYTEINASGQNGDKARLISPILDPGQYCLVFWYSMTGSGSGTLNVYLEPNNTVIFNKSGNTAWRSAVIYYTAPEKYKIVIEGIRAEISVGKITVDDISFTPGMCIGCNFDAGMCLWEQNRSNEFHWIYSKEATPSPTGAITDHTSANGSYIYVKRRGSERNKTARVFSPLQNEGKYCFSLWYYMYGAHTNTLQIYQTNQLDEKKLVFRITGQDNRWTQGKALIQSTVQFQVLIEGKLISQLPQHSEIAVDDILMFSCQDCVDPTPSFGRLNSTNFQFGSTLDLICDPGYFVKGNVSIVCQSGGIWSERPTCEPLESKNRSVFLAIYVVVPTVATNLLVTILIIHCRRKTGRHLKAFGIHQNHDKKAKLKTRLRFENMKKSKHKGKIQTNTDKDGTDNDTYDHM